MFQSLNTLEGKTPITPIDSLYLAINSIVRTALGQRAEWNKKIQTYIDLNGKFTKVEAIYTPIAPPAVLWEYSCGECIAFQRETFTCRWVSEKGYPNLNKIHPQGWCVIWMPKEGVVPLSYIGKVPWVLREPPPEFP